MHTHFKKTSINHINQRPQYAHSFTRFLYSTTPECVHSVTGGLKRNQAGVVDGEELLYIWVAQPGSNPLLGWASGRAPSGGDPQCVL